MRHKPIMVIGGGTAGMAAALEAAQNGLGVYLVEKQNKLGGRADAYCCKATDECQKCSICLVPQLRAQVEGHPNINLLLECRVSRCSGSPGSFVVTLESDNGIRELEVHAVILATGFAPFDAGKKGEFHYGFHPHVVTAAELEQVLQAKGAVTTAFGKLSNIGFIQCVGSRDLAVGNNYCSKVCCSYTVKLAKVLKNEFPNANISIFYTDIQTFGKEFDRFIKAAKVDDEIRFVRGIPAKIFSYPYNHLTVRYADSLTGERIEDKFDLIVLATAITPGKDTAALAGIFEIELDGHGFFAVNPLDKTQTSRTGIFATGTCQSPQDILQSIEQSRAVIGAVLNSMLE